MNRYVELLREARETYRAEAEALAKNKHVFDGIFGTGSSVKNNACHDRFDARIEEILRQMTEEGAAAREIGEAVAFVLDGEAKNEAMSSVDIYLIAVQRHCLPLIALMPRESAAGLLERYVRAWPRHTRLPVQAEIVKRLKSRVQ